MKGCKLIGKAYCLSALQAGRKEVVDLLLKAAVLWNLCRSKNLIAPSVAKGQLKHMQTVE